MRRAGRQRREASRDCRHADRLCPGDRGASREPGSSRDARLGGTGAGRGALLLVRDRQSADERILGRESREGRTPMNHYAASLYRLAPAWAQNVMLSGFATLLGKERYGGRYDEFRQLLSETQWRSRQEIQAYQDERLRSV